MKNQVQVTLLSFIFVLVVGITTCRKVHVDVDAMALNEDRSTSALVVSQKHIVQISDFIDQQPQLNSFQKVGLKTYAQSFQNKDVMYMQKSMNESVNMAVAATGYDPSNVQARFDCHGDYQVLANCIVAVHDFFKVCYCATEADDDVDAILQAIQCGIQIFTAYGMCFITAIDFFYWMFSK